MTPFFLFMSCPRGACPPVGLCATMHHASSWTWDTPAGVRAPRLAPPAPAVFPAGHHQAPPTPLRVGETSGRRSSVPCIAKEAGDHPLLRRPFRPPQGKRSLHPVSLIRQHHGDCAACPRSIPLLAVRGAGQVDSRYCVAQVLEVHESEADLYHFGHGEPTAPVVDGVVPHLACAH